MEEMQKRQLATGLMLIGVGLALYFLLRAQDHVGPLAVIFLLGAAFVAAYLYFKETGYLIPGCILLGFSSGYMWGETKLSFGNTTLIGIGAGFIGIYVIRLIYEKRSAWWPLIPGTILVLLGIGFTEDIVKWLFDNWPLILVLIGIILVISSFLRSRRRGT